MRVFFITDGRGNVQIMLEPRIGQLPSGNKVIRVIEDAGPATEKWLHERYANRRLPWFMYTKEMLTVVPPSEINPRERVVQEEVDEYMRAGLSESERRLYDLYYRT